MKPKLCSSCKRGGNEVEADYLATGRTFEWSDSGTPFKGYLCSDHLQIMEEDGATLRIVSWLTIKAKRERMTSLWQDYETAKAHYLAGIASKDDRRINSWGAKMSRLHKAWCQLQDEVGDND